MRAHEFINESVEEGVGTEMLKGFIPGAIRMWLEKKLQKGQYDALASVYKEIMQDELNPPRNARDALYRAAKTVGLDPRVIYQMFGDKGIPSET